MAEYPKPDVLKGADVREVDLSGARFRGGNFTGLKVTDGWFVDVDIDAMVRNVVINGVDVVPYVNEELNRRYPERAKLHPTDPEGMRETWGMLTMMWDATVARARRMPERKLNESADGEWSFVETLRHLVFAIDKWFTAPVLDEPYAPLGLPNTGAGSLAFLGIDDTTRPTFAEVLTVRADRVARLAEYLDRVTPADLTGSHHVLGAGDPPVQACLHVVFGEEWAHHRYATRDLDILEAGQ